MNIIDTMANIALVDLLRSLKTNTYFPADIREDAVKYKGASAETIKEVYDQAKVLNTYPATGSTRYINLMRMLRILWDMSDFPSPGILSHIHELEQ